MSADRNVASQLKLRELLDHYLELYNHPSFVEHDPISVPHAFSKNQDIEIAGFFAAILAWGLRKTTIKNCLRLMELMDQAPYDFVRNHTSKEHCRFEKWVHRTFSYTDTVFFLTRLQQIYQRYDGLAVLFQGETMKEKITSFQLRFFDQEDAPHRTRKHIASPQSGSTCKRINMFLRWMVRKDDKGVDFGIWSDLIPSDQLIIPVDVHVERVARDLGLVTRKQRDWTMAEELTTKLKFFDALDPVKYDFALFGLGVNRVGRI